MTTFARIMDELLKAREGLMPRAAPYVLGAALGCLMTMWMGLDSLSSQQQTLTLERAVVKTRVQYVNVEKKVEVIKEVVKWKSLQADSMVTQTYSPQTGIVTLTELRGLRLLENEDLKVMSNSTSLATMQESQSEQSYEKVSQSTPMARYGLAVRLTDNWTVTTARSAMSGSETSWLKMFEVGGSMRLANTNAWLDVSAGWQRFSLGGRYEW
jgi:hypothetical protein